MNTNIAGKEIVDLSASVEMLHNDFTQSISFIKSSQWNATNYTALIYAAIFSLKMSKVPGSIECQYHNACYLLFGLWFIFYVSSVISLREKRERLKRIRSYLHSDVKNIFENIDYKGKGFRDFIAIYIPHAAIVMFSHWVVISVVAR